MAEGLVHGTLAPCARQAALAESQIAESDYASYVDAMPGDEPDDRRHMAAAAAGRAQAIITWNRPDLPAEPGGYGAA